MLAAAVPGPLPNVTRVWDAKRLKRDTASWPTCETCASLEQGFSLSVDGDGSSTDSSDRRGRAHQLPTARHCRCSHFLPVAVLQVALAGFLYSCCKGSFDIPSSQPLNLASPQFLLAATERRASRAMHIKVPCTTQKDGWQLCEDAFCAGIRITGVSTGLNATSCHKECSQDSDCIAYEIYAATDSGCTLYSDCTAIWKSPVGTHVRIKPGSTPEPRPPIPDAETQKIRVWPEPSGFDCASEQDLWQTAWSARKASYCCRTVHVGC